MKALSATIEMSAKVFEWIVTACFFVILTLTIVLVILRYGFNASIVWGSELVEYLFIYTTGLGAAVAMARREHIKITWFIDKLSPQFRKAVDVFDFLLVALINAVMIAYSLRWIRTVGNFKSPVLRLPNRFIQVVVPVGCTLVIIYCFLHVLATILPKETKA